MSALSDSIAEGGSDDDASDVVMYADNEYTNTSEALTTGDDDGEAEGDNDDMEITPSQLECMTVIYEQYELHSRSYKDQQKMINNKKEGTSFTPFISNYLPIFTISPYVMSLPTQGPSSL